MPLVSLHASMLPLPYQEKEAGHAVAYLDDAGGQSLAHRRHMIKSMKSAHFSSGETLKSPYFPVPKEKQHLKILLTS